MKIDEITIRNFRGIESLENVKLKDLSIFIGENGTAKTSVLEAINFCLSPSFLSDRLEHTDFHNGGDEPIEIYLKFDSDFSAFLPDGYQKQEVKCNAISLKAKKRDKAKAGKAFSALVVTTHHVVPNRPMDNAGGWVIKRKSGTIFKFDTRLLSFPVETKGLCRSFYFNRSREKQIKKGFRTSVTSVFEDFNWRFSKAIRKANPPLTIKQDQENLEGSILKTIDPQILKATLDEVNKKIKDLNIPEIGLSFLDGNAPFNNAFLRERVQNLELPTSQMGSGIEMVISVVFLETLASLSKEDIIILVDEPELHLHPKLQTSLVNYFVGISKTNQVLCSTHSPYLYKHIMLSTEVELLVCRKDDAGKLTVSNSARVLNLFPWSPSWGEVNFYAFDMPTIEFHNELYGFLQERHTAFNEGAIELLFTGRGIRQNKQWIRLQGGIPQNPDNVTTSTYIRHSIHHPENTQNPRFTNQELIDSINELVTIVRSP